MENFETFLREMFWQTVCLGCEVCVILAMFLRARYKTEIARLRIENLRIPIPGLVELLLGLCIVAIFCTFLVGRAPVIGICHSLAFAILILFETDYYRAQIITIEISSSQK